MSSFSGLKKSFMNLFEKTSVTNHSSTGFELIPQSDFAFHYIWINKEPFIVQNNDKYKSSPIADIFDEPPLCGVPLHYVDCAIQNAKYYPDATFTIWVDKTLLNDSPSLFFLQSHIFASDCKNITVRDLNEINDYKQMMIEYHDHSLWHKVDLARLHVLKFCTNPEYPNKNNVYADFDIENVFKHWEKIASALDEYGIAIGGAKTDTSSIENGYIAIQNSDKGKKAISDILDFILRDDGKAIKLNRKYYSQVFKEFVSSIEIMIAKQIPSPLPDRPLWSHTMQHRDNIIIPSMQRYCGYKIPYPKEYHEICITASPSIV